MPANSLPAYLKKSGIPTLDLITITTSDSADLANVVRQIYVGVGGDVTVITASGATATFPNAPQGGHLGPFEVARVKATGTTAGGLIGYV